MPKLGDNVVLYPGETDQEFQPSVILDSASGEDLKYVLILGWTADEEIYVASSSVSLPDRLWVMEAYKALMMQPVSEDEE